MQAKFHAPSFLAAAAVTIAVGSQVNATITDPVRIDGVPTPQNLVLIEEGGTYIVPPGRILVLHSMPGFSGTARINGVQALQPLEGNTAQAGDEVTITDQTPALEANLLGYLVKE